MKNCIKCGLEKEREAFHLDSRRPDGLFPYCKECRRIPRTPKKCRSAEQVLSEYVLNANTGCKEWIGVLSRDGYGMCCYKAQRQRAHRLAFFTANPDADQGLLVLHKCDNRKCINVDHLYLGTCQDNSTDMVQRGRCNPRRGIHAHNARLNDEKAMAIFLDERTYAEIAMDYGIAATTVQGIKNKRLWKHATASAA